MPVPARTRWTRRPAIRTAGVTMALAIVVTACGNTADSAGPPAPYAIPGQPPGTIQVPGGPDVPGTVQRVQDAITAVGGVVVTVVDLAADARAAGVEIPASSVVVGGQQAAELPLLRADQRAAANLPQHYLVRQATDGTVSLTVDSADYVSAVSGVVVPDARAALRDSTAGIVGQAIPGTTIPVGSPLVGVTPINYLITAPSRATVPATVDRLRREADRAPTNSVAVTDLAAGSADPGPAIRATSVVFVSNPEAAAPLLATTPSLALDLPLRFVVWADDQNRTQVGYPDVRRIAARHGVAAEDPNVARLVDDATRIARVAAG